MSILQAIQQARLVQINGHTLLKRFACDPSDDLLADDIVLKAWADGGELELTLDDITGAVELEPNAYRLRSGAVLCFYRRPTIH
jgi:hypothetical protein